MQLIKFGGLTDVQNSAIVKLISYKVDYNKLWSTETGRSITGEFNGTLLGIFPKLTITIKAPKNPVIISGRTYNSREITKLLLTILNSDYNLITYFDPSKNRMVEKTFYFGDISTEVLKAVMDTKLRFGQISVEAVATTRLNDEE